MVFFIINTLKMGAKQKRWPQQIELVKMLLCTTFWPTQACIIPAKAQLDNLPLATRGTTDMETYPTFSVLLMIYYLAFILPTSTFSVNRSNPEEHQLRPYKTAHKSLTKWALDTLFNHGGRPLSHGRLGAPHPAPSHTTISQDTFAVVSIRQGNGR